MMKWNIHGDDIWNNSVGDDMKPVLYIGEK
jgi:hypothetical protein